MTEWMINKEDRDVSQILTLAFLRRSRGIKVADLARSVNVSTSTIYGWQSKRRSPRLSQLQSLAEALDLNHYELGALVVWYAQ